MMHLFNLVRDDDETGVSGTGIVAGGVIWPDGTVAMRWFTAATSAAFYTSIEDVEAIHGHGGKTRVVIESDVFTRGIHDATQDRCEGVQYGSVGKDPENWTCPGWITEEEWPMYRRGYAEGIVLIRRQWGW